MKRFSFSATTCLVLGLVAACGGDDKNALTGAGPDASVDDDAGANGGRSGGGNGRAGSANGGSSNGGADGMDAAAPDASLPNASPDASIDAGPGSTDAGDGGGVADGGVDAAVAVCGNNVVEGTEGCDDGNTDSNDGCTGDCWAIETTQTVTAGPSLGVSIPDDGYSGPTSSMVCLNLVAGAFAGDNISSMTVDLAMTHTFVGDLVIKLVSPAATVVTLMSRPGFTETTDDGVEATFGNNADLSSSSPIEFSQAAVTSAESMGTGLTTLQVVCAANAVCSFLPNAGAATAGTLASFNGQASTGTWKLCVGDVTSGDLGTVDAVTLTIEH